MTKQESASTSGHVEQSEISLSQRVGQELLRYAQNDKECSGQLQKWFVTVKSFFLSQMRDSK